MSNTPNFNLDSEPTATAVLMIPSYNFSFRTENNDGENIQFLSPQLLSGGSDAVIIGKVLPNPDDYSLANRQYVNYSSRPYDAFTQTSIEVINVLRNDINSLNINPKDTIMITQSGGPLNDNGQESNLINANAYSLNVFTHFLELGQRYCIFLKYVNGNYETQTYSTTNLGTQTVTRSIRDIWVPVNDNDGVWIYNSQSKTYSSTSLVSSAEAKKIENYPEDDFISLVNDPVKPDLNKLGIQPL
ncbi:MULTISPECIES: hypothetical protein [Bacillus cereus group]|uniref:hypothetical protein n=1 Tax=Bacillus cereus group TaxID=86661 RepID=UPI000BEB7771|nr:MULTISPECIES: hypothetical protein [Bacillus cereus group]PEE32760.1 hypothetical protein CON59_29300 [Bacillus cereus]PEK73975.1 hypothetical protein CN594_33680 [Bacillus toyonensis]PEO45612.1 hypothetical protein CN579_31785 [Bacillus toyonensis]PET38214.1 hypothetical protein CN523_26530 [Bacillus cereus]PEV73216.1 hypothetical protein CN429_28000 [Bacillus cereus]